MNEFARIASKGGITLVPAETPYERELLFDHANSYALAAKRVCLSINNHSWTITVDAHDGQFCAHCHQPLHGLVYRRSRSKLCAKCVRREWTRALAA